MTRRERRNGALTELEGAVLMVIQRFGRCTPYRVRQDFLASRSKEWSGSAGAVYPALRRLAAAGFLTAHKTESARRSVVYAMTPRGRRALADWLADVERMISPGLDPFRCRVDLWSVLPEKRRAALVRDLARALTKECAALRSLMQHPGDELEPHAVELGLALQTSRLEWLRKRYKV